MLEDLNNHCGDATPYFAGGAVTKDEVFMTYKASILGREILVLDTDEISALGAALAAAGAAGDEALLSSFSSSSLVRRSFVPDRRISSGLSGVYEEYRRIMEYGSSDLFQ
jgi:sugar (pentulose or hexulose) kinase